MGGGGGTRGEVSFPDYIDAWMDELLTDGNGTVTLPLTLEQIIQGANNPYNDPFAPTDYANPADFVTLGSGGMSDPGDFYAGALKGAVDDQSPGTAVSNRFNDGQRFRDDLNNELPNVDFSAFTAEGTAAGLLREGDAEASAQQVVDPEGDYASFLQKAAEEADLRLEDINFSNLPSDAEDFAELFTANAQTVADPGVNEEVTGADFLRKGVEVADEAGVIDELNWSAILNAAKQAAGDQLSAAVSKAQAVIDSQELQDLVDAHARRIEDEYEQRVAEFASSMSDINAVNSSAYAIGLALIRAEHQEDVANYDAKLSFQLFQQALELHRNNLVDLVQARLRTDVVNKQSREQFVQGVAEVISGVYAEVRRLEAVYANMEQQVFSTHVQAETQVEGQNKQARDRMIQVGAESLQNLYQLQQDFRKLYIQLFEDYAKFYTDKELQSNQLELQKKMGAAELGHQMSLRFWQQVLSTRADMFNQLMSNTAAFFEAHNSYISSEMTKRAREEMWQLDIWEKGSNILAAPAGMARSLPEGNSKAQGAIGGALSGAGTGAAVGSAVPGLGTGVGAAAGTILGGISGYLGSG